VTANYAPDAVLLATVSNRPRTDSAGIKDYFMQRADEVRPLQICGGARQKFFPAAAA
jgi:hypothetical protein